MDGRDRVSRIAAAVGLDVGKGEHHATVLSATGEQLFERTLRNDEAEIERLVDLAEQCGQAALVID